MRGESGPIKVNEIWYNLNPNHKGLKDPLKTFLAHPKGKEWAVDTEVHPGEASNWSWDRAIRAIDGGDLVEALGFESAAYIWAECTNCSPLDDWFRKNHPLLGKLENTLWLYGARTNYRLLAEALVGIKALTTEIQDLELHLTWTSGFNPYGYSNHIRGEGVRCLYLDAPLGLLIYYKRKHVLTIGFAVSQYGILLTQVQLREKKGNRWLYKLPKSYFEWSIDLLATAFPGMIIHIPTGESVVDAVKRAYGSSPCGMTPGDETRIAATYNAPLVGYTREPCNAPDYQWYHRIYNPLRRTEGSPCIG